MNSSNPSPGIAPQPRAGTLIATALACVAALALFPLARLAVPDWAHAANGLLLAHEALQFALALALLGAVLRFGRWRPRDLGLVRPGLATLGWGVLGGLAVIVAGTLTIAAVRLSGLTQPTGMLAALASRPPLVVLAIALTAAVSEEIAFRAVLVTHLARLTGRFGLGAALSILAFAAGHATGWGPIQVLLTLPAGIVLTVLFAWKRDLGACIIAHFLTDALGLLSYGHGAA